MGKAVRDGCGPFQELACSQHCPETAIPHTIINPFRVHKTQRETLLHLHATVGNGSCRSCSVLFINVQREIYTANVTPICGIEGWGVRERSRSRQENLHGALITSALSRRQKREKPGARNLFTGFCGDQKLGCVLCSTGEIGRCAMYFLVRIFPHCGEAGPNR